MDTKILFLCIAILIFLVYYYSETFCNVNFKELADPSKKIKRCCPKIGKFKLVSYGKKKDKWICCQNFKKKISKKEKPHYIQLPDNAGFCTSAV